jgi:DUF4097 and DUF4098 domain-containing protein YvlB
VDVVTDPPSGLKNVSVDLEITVPPHADLDLHTGAGDIIVRDVQGDVRADSGAGDVDVRDVTGELDAHTGAGSIDVRRATGSVDLDTGAGSIDYRGAPQGYCRFNTGAGSIEIELPADANLELDLDTGVGDVDVDMFVDGSQSNRKVRGIIGDGSEGEIRAHTGAGNIDVTSQ